MKKSKSEAMEKNIRGRKYISRGAALRVVTIADGLTAQDRNYLRELVTSVYGWGPTTGIRGFDSLKANIEHGHYVARDSAHRAVTLSQSLTKAERAKLKKFVDAHFNAKEARRRREKKVRKNFAEKTKVSKAPAKREVDPRVMRQGDYITVFLDSTNDIRFVDKVLNLGRAAIDANSTLPALISAIEIRRKELKAG